MSVPGEAMHSRIDSDWILPEPAAREAVCTRSLVCRSFRREDGLLEIDGRFVDTRPFDYVSEFRGQCPAGSALHHMQLRLTVDRSRHIVALVSAMPATPYGSCAEVNGNFQRLVGVSIGRGFRKLLSELLGGVEGCTHVIALLEAMAAAAVQAFASEARMPRLAGSPQPVRIWHSNDMENSCYSFRSDGPVMQRMKRQAEESESALNNTMETK
jgi:PAS domain-containing protein